MFFRSSRWFERQENMIPDFAKSCNFHLEGLF